MYRIPSSQARKVVRIGNRSRRSLTGCYCGGLGGGATKGRITHAIAMVKTLSEAKTLRTNGRKVVHVDSRREPKGMTQRRKGPKQPTVKATESSACAIDRQQLM